MVWCGRGVVAASSGPAAGWALYWATGNEIPYLSSSEQQQTAVMVTAVCCCFVTAHAHLIKPVYRREKWLRSLYNECRIKIIVDCTKHQVPFENDRDPALNVISVSSSRRDASAVLYGKVLPGDFLGILKCYHMSASEFGLSTQTRIILFVKL